MVYTISSTTTTSSCNTHAFSSDGACFFLSVRLRDLLGDAEWPGEVVPLTDLPSRIAAHVASHGISIDQFEEEVGWALCEFLQSPVKVAAESPIMFLQAVADHLGINWRSMVPDEHAV